MGIVEIPKDSAMWLAKYRMGEVENQFGEFFCPEPGCVCEFGTLTDLILHHQSGKHGRMGDRMAEQNRHKFKYYTRQGRFKEQKYREEHEEIVVEQSKLE